MPMPLKESAETKKGKGSSSVDWADSAKLTRNVISLKGMQQL